MKILYNLLVGWFLLVGLLSRREETSWVQKPLAFSDLEGPFIWRKFGGE